MGTGAAALIFALRYHHALQFLLLHHFVVECERTFCPPEPRFVLQDYQNAGADQITFHLEAIVGEPVPEGGDKHPGVCDLIKEIRDAGMYVGIAIKPATPAEAVIPYVEDIDMVTEPSSLHAICPDSSPCVWHSL